MEKKSIKKVVAFDFDDTLAITDSLVGVRSVSNTDLSKVFADHGIKPARETGGWTCVDSRSYEILLSTGGAFLSDLEFDYTETMSVDLENIIPIEAMIRNMRQHLADPEVLVIVLTARAGYAEVWSDMNQRFVSARNRQGISAFLNSQGIIIPEHHIHTVGDVAAEGGSTSVAKADVLAHYAMLHKPLQIVLYDDSQRNIDQVQNINRRFKTGCEIVTNHVEEGVVTEVISSKDKKGLKQWFYSILKTMLE